MNRVLKSKKKKQQQQIASCVCFSSFLFFFSLLVCLPDAASGIVSRRERKEESCAYVCCDRVIRKRDRWKNSTSECGNRMTCTTTPSCCRNHKRNSFFLFLFCCCKRSWAKLVWLLEGQRDKEKRSRGKVDQSNTIDCRVSELNHRTTFVLLNTTLADAHRQAWSP